MLAALSLLFAALGVVAASPVRRASWEISQDVKDTWVSLAHYAGAAYCNSDSIRAWSCGHACDNLAGGMHDVLTVGGDSHETPYYYVVNNGSSVIVAISGTNPFSVPSIVNDINFTPVTPSWDHFPDSNGVKVHIGFYDTFKRMAPTILSAVQKAVGDGSTDVIVTGHSLGSAVGHLMAVYLSYQLGWSASVRARLFASPRVGNKAWADYVDSRLPDSVQHLNNYNDPVPQLPPRWMGFQHSSNELWITNDAGDHVVACWGQESGDCQNSLGIQGHIEAFKEDLNLGVHLGPYLGVWISSFGCS